MEKREVIYNGESVKIYGTDVPEEILVRFTDSITCASPTASLPSTR